MVRGRASESAENIDATGCLLFPGFIDPRVHSRDPGLTEKEDLAHSTRAAAAGGITTLLEMPNTIPLVADEPTFRARPSGTPAWRRSTLACGACHSAPRTSTNCRAWSKKGSAG